uniref:Seminal fluid protein HACP036 n=1 Tax=Heliconius melpomene TaxID=34740 RepID=D9HQ86_HELME|nr:seminal fluid protein HACP036 [Heliconius melpomene]
MVIALIIIVLATILQNSIEIAINNEATSSSESEEKLRFRNPKVPRSYLERTNVSSSTEDASVIHSYEGIRKIPEKLDNSKTIDKVKTEYLRNFDNQDDEFYKESVKSESAENRRDISIAVDKSEDEDVSYKRPEYLRNFFESTDTSEFEDIEHLRKSHKENPDSIKYNSYESIKNKLEKDKWSLMRLRPNLEPGTNMEKRILPAFLWFIGSNVLSLGIGELIKKG